MFKLARSCFIGILIYHLVKAATDNEAVLNKIIDDFKERLENVVTENNLNCDNYMGQCEDMLTQILLIDCKKFLHAYLCFNVTSNEDLKNIYVQTSKLIEEKAKEEEERAKAKDITTDRTVKNMF